MSIFENASAFLTRSASAVATGIRTGLRSKTSKGERAFAEMFSAGGAANYPAASSLTTFEQVRHYRLWTYVAVRAIAEEIARRPPHVAYVRRPRDLNGPDGAMKRKLLLPRNLRLKAMAPVQPQEELEPVDSDHALYRLVHNPNQPDTAYSFWFRTILFLELTGKCYWWKVRNGAGSAVVELWPLFPHWVTPIRGQERIIEKYIVRPIGEGMSGYKPMTLDADDVVPILYPSPLSLIEGWSPTLAGAEWINSAEAIDTSRWREFENGSFPGMVLKFDPKIYGPQGPSETDIKRMGAQIEAKTRGPEKAGRLLALQPGMDVAQVSRSQTEMSYIDSGAQMQDWVLALHRVGKSIAGITDDANYSNMITTTANFLSRTCGPKLTLIGQVATEHVAHEFDPNLCMYWPDLTPDDREQKLKDYTAVPGPAVTINEYRRDVLHLEPLEHGGDNPMVQGRELPYGTGVTVDDQMLDDGNESGSGETQDDEGKSDEIRNRMKALLNGNGRH